MIRCPKPPKKYHMVVLESAPGGRVEGGIAQCAIESAASNALFGSLIEGAVRGMGLMEELDKYCLRRIRC